MVEKTSAADLSDLISLAFLVVLETLTPVERAVFLLLDPAIRCVAARAGRDTRNAQRGPQCHQRM